MFAPSSRSGLPRRGQRLFGNVISFGNLSSVATRVGFGEKRCRKNLPLSDLSQKEIMAYLPPMDRSVTKLTTLDQQGLDSGVPNATPAERLLMVWPLTLTAWAFKEPNVVQPRLQRHVARVIRRED